MIIIALKCSPSKLMQPLYRPPMDTPPLSPNSDFKRFVEDLQVAWAAAAQASPEAIASD